MYCNNCGNGVGTKAKFCSNCGHNAADAKQEGVVAIKNKLPAWFKIILGLITAVGLVGLTMVFMDSDLTDTVEEHIEAIKNNHIPHAYHDYTSRDFQTAVSLDSFETFIGHFSVFSNNQSVRFIDRNTNGKDGTLDAILSDLSGSDIVVQYRLVKENEKWKIFSIQIEDKNLEKNTKTATKKSEGKSSAKQIVVASHVENTSTVKDPSESFDEQPLIDTVSNFLKMLRGGDAKLAYQKYASAEFVKSTTLDEFLEFVKEQPAFSKNQESTVGHLTFDNNIAMLSGLLWDDKHESYEVEYHLAFEDNMWKIMHISISTQQLFSPNTNHQESTQFAKLILGNALDENKEVAKPLSLFKKDDRKIYLDLHIHQGRVGTPIDVTLEHLESRSKIDPVNAQIETAGDSILSIIFTSGEDGWPAGTYAVDVRSGDGSEGTVEFKVEE